MDRTKLKEAVVHSHLVEGYSIKGTADNIGCSYRIVYRIARKLMEKGLISKQRPFGEKKEIIPSIDDLFDLVMNDETENFTTIAQRYNYSSERVRQLFLAEGITGREIKRYQRDELKFQRGKLLDLLRAYHSHN